MMEIKFRAWDKITNSIYEAGGLQIVRGQVEVRLLGNGVSGTERIRAKNWDDLMLLQYTGLKDKNGREIYEGDLVTFGSWVAGLEDWRHQAAVVEWSDKEACFLLTKTCNISLSHQKEPEVIGNIYENPELLTPNQDASA